MAAAPVRDDIDVYWGVASGSSHAALHNYYEGDPFFSDAPAPIHAMVSYRTAENQVWAGPTWMVDNGGNPGTIKRHGGHPDSVHDYLDWLANPRTRYGDDLADIDVRYFALRDWPCEPDVREALGLTVSELQNRTLIDHINNMNAYEDRNIDIEPMAVLQGWEEADYLQAIDAYRDHGLITDKIAIGTLCTRTDPTLIRNTAYRIARNLPSRCSIHGFGVKGPVLEEPDALRVFGSIDTAAWNYALRQATKDNVVTAAPTNRYEDYVDWSERGNPRSTAENMWIDYRGYARNLAGMVPVETPHEERVVTLNEFYETRPESVRVDEYIVVECPCGQILDPGRPEPLIGGRAGCRHCDRAALNIETQRITLEDQIRMGERAFEDAQQFRGHLAMEQMKDDIRGRMREE